MSRFLFVVPPLTGHVNPTVSVAAALAARGHEVAWVGHPGKVRPLLPADARLFALDDHVPSSTYAAATERAANVRGLEALKFLWEDFFVPLARAMRSGVEAAVDAFGPDVVVADQQALAGAFVARARHLPWATFATTSAGVTSALASLPLVQRWLDDQLAALETEWGLPPLAPPDLSPALVVAFSTRAFVGDDVAVPAQVRYVGPSIQQRAETTPFPFERLTAHAGPRLLVSLGTVNGEAGGRFYATVQEAFRGSPFLVVLVAPPALVPDPPQNVIVRPFVPQLALLPQVDAVICHAGHNTTVEALAHERPLVVLPIKDDQPVVAEQVERSGAGLRLKFARVKPAELRAAAERVLGEPSFRERAAALARGFAAAGGAARAADHLEALLAPANQRASSVPSRAADPFSEAS